VRSAMIASGLALPARRITVNLAPADLPNASETALSGNPTTVNLWMIIVNNLLKRLKIKIAALLRFHKSPVKLGTRSRRTKNR